MVPLPLKRATLRLAHRQHNGYLWQGFTGYVSQVDQPVPRNNTGQLRASSASACQGSGAMGVLERVSSPSPYVKRKSSGKRRTSHTG